MRGRISRPTRMRGRSKLDLIPLLCVVFSAALAAWALFGSMSTEAMSPLALPGKKGADEAVATAGPLSVPRALSTKTTPTAPIVSAEKEDLLCPCPPCDTIASSCDPAINPLGG